MAITAAQTIADRKSLATQSAKNTNTIAKAVRAANCARESIGSAVFSRGGDSLRSLLGLDNVWPGIARQFLVSYSSSPELETATEFEVSRATQKTCVKGSGGWIGRLAIATLCPKAAPPGDRPAALQVST
jgi:hypothetical protein